MDIVKTDWKCKLHDTSQHDFFINYRVSADKEFARDLAHHLNATKSHKGVHMRAFLDAFCLPVGENWQESFLNGLMSAKVIVLLISNATIEGIKHANEKQDNVLLEYEYAFQRLDEEGPNKVMIFPVFLGTRETISHNGKHLDLYKDFEFPFLGDFPDEPHKITNPCHIPKKGSPTIQTIMKRLFMMHGRKLRDFSDPSGLISELREKQAYMHNQEAQPSPPALSKTVCGLIMLAITMLVAALVLATNNMLHTSHEPPSFVTLYVTGIENSGKSQLIESMFDFKTKPSQRTRANQEYGIFASKTTMIVVDGAAPDQDGFALPEKYTRGPVIYLCVMNGLNISRDQISLMNKVTNNMRKQQPDDAHNDKMIIYLSKVDALYNTDASKTSSSTTTPTSSSTTTTPTTPTPTTPTLTTTTKTTTTTHTIHKLQAERCGKLTKDTNITCMFGTCLKRNSVYLPTHYAYEQHANPFSLKEVLGEYLEKMNVGEGDVNTLLKFDDDEGDGDFFSLF